MTGGGARPRVRCPGCATASVKARSAFAFPRRFCRPTRADRRASRRSRTSAEPTVGLVPEPLPPVLHRRDPALPLRQCGHAAADRREAVAEPSAGQQPVHRRLHHHGADRDGAHGDSRRAQGRRVGPKADLSRWVYRAADPGAALSNSVAGFIANSFGYSAAFLFLAACAVFALLVFWLGVPETRDAEAGRPP